MALQEQSLVDIAMPGQYMNGEEPSQEGIVFLEGISANVHVSIITICLGSMSVCTSTATCYSKVLCSHKLHVLTLHCIVAQHTVLHHVTSPHMMCAVTYVRFIFNE